MEEYILKNDKETKELGFLTAQNILDEGSIGKAVVIVLEGELGAGKTTFLQGFAKGLGIRERIQSPTFIIMNRFKIKDKYFKDYYHFDCYRLDSEKDMEIFNFKDLVLDFHNIICIEWGSNIYKALPSERIDILIKVTEEKKRKIIIKR